MPQTPWALPFAPEHRASGHRREQRGRSISRAREHPEGHSSPRGRFSPRSIVATEWARRWTSYLLRDLSSPGTNISCSQKMAAATYRTARTVRSSAACRCGVSDFSSSSCFKKLPLGRRRALPRASTHISSGGVGRLARLWVGKRAERLFHGWCASPMDGTP